MMEHVQAHRGKTQHLADVPVRAWRKVTLANGTKVQLVGATATLCGKTLGVTMRMLENPQDCKRCRKVASQGSA